LQPRHRLFVRHAGPGGDRAAAGSLRPSAGGTNEEAMPRARDVTPRGRPAVSKLPCLAAEPGPRIPARVFSAHRHETPRAFHGFNQPPGDRSPRLDRGPTNRRTPQSRGSRRPFDLREPSHRCAKRMTAGPVRAVRLPVARRCAPRGASRLSSDASPWCFESASTTDVSLASTRRKNTLFGGCPPSAVGKPAGVPLRDPPRAGVTASVRGRRRTTSRSSGLQRLRA